MGMVLYWLEYLPSLPKFSLHKMDWEILWMGMGMKIKKKLRTSRTLEDWTSNTANIPFLPKTELWTSQAPPKNEMDRDTNFIIKNCPKFFKIFKTEIQTYLNTYYLKRLNKKRVWSNHRSLWFTIESFSPIMEITKIYQLKKVWNVNFWGQNSGLNFHKKEETWLFWPQKLTFQTFFNWLWKT